jgi:hypothetical protein
MPFGNKPKFGFRLREGNIEDPLPLTHSFDKKLKCQSRLASARAALVQVHPLSIKSAAKNIVKACAPGRDTRGVGFGALHDVTWLFHGQEDP